MKKVEIIPVNILIYLMDRIMPVNFFIKRRELPMAKSGFYNIKKHIIYYIIQSIEKGYYDPEVVSWEIKEVSDQTTSEHTTTLFTVELNIAGHIYEVHQVANDYMWSTLLHDKFKTFETHAEYMPASETAFNAENYPTGELMSLWEEIVDMCETYNWAIYDYLPHAQYRMIMAKRYNKWVISNPPHLGDNTEISLNVKGMPEKKMKFLTFRENIRDIVREHYKDKVFVSYNYSKVRH